MKKFFVLIYICSSLFSASIDEIDRGDIMYINSGIFGEDRRVEVIRVNETKGRVKVWTSNGDTEWVYPSQLLTKPFYKE